MINGYLLVLVQSSGHTPHLLHRQPHFGFVDVLFRQKAVGFPYSRKAIRRLIFVVRSLPVFLYYALDVGSLGQYKDCLMLFRSEIDNSHDNPFEYFARIIHSKQ